MKYFMIKMLVNLKVARVFLFPLPAAIPFSRYWSSGNGNKKWEKSQYKMGKKVAGGLLSHQILELGELPFPYKALSLG